MEEMSVTNQNSVNLGVGHPHQMINEAVGAFDSFTNQTIYQEPPKPSRIPEPQELNINEDLVVENVTEDSRLSANDTNQNPIDRTIKEEEVDENEAPKIDYEAKSVSTQCGKN